MCLSVLANNIIKKESPKQCLPAFGFCEILKNKNFVEHQRTTASKYSIYISNSK